MLSSPSGVCHLYNHTHVGPSSHFTFSRLLKSTAAVGALENNTAVAPRIKLPRAAKFAAGGWRRLPNTAPTHPIYPGALSPPRLPSHSPATRLPPVPPRRRPSGVHRPTVAKGPKGHKMYICAATCHTQQIHTSHIVHSSAKCFYLIFWPTKGGQLSAVTFESQAPACSMDELSPKKSDIVSYPLGKIVGRTFCRIGISAPMESIFLIKIRHFVQPQNGENLS